MVEYRLGVQLHGHADDVSRRDPSPLLPLLSHHLPRLSLLPLQACGDTLGFDPPAPEPEPSACGGFDSHSRTKPWAICFVGSPRVWPAIRSSFVASVGFGLPSLGPFGAFLGEMDFECECIGGM